MFLSTPPSRVATYRRELGYVDDPVSIHATLAGGDCSCSGSGAVLSVVSIHATLAGGDYSLEVPYLPSLVFLSTPPSRVATEALGGYLPEN